MSVAFAPTLSKPHLFTVEDVLRMIAAGILPEKARVCLRAGELIDMPAEGALHSDVKSALIQSIAARAAGIYRIGADTPLRLSDHDWPEPDLYLLPPSIRPSQASGPDVLLLIEVADSSLAEDLGPQVALYARFGVREYWVIDLASRRVHVHQRIEAGAYAALQVHGPNALVAAQFAPEIGVRLNDLLG